MPVRANWFEDDGDVLDAEVERLGQPIQLDSAGELRVQLHALVDQERDLFNQGIECEIKDRSDTCCAACPLRGDGNLGALCEIGVKQDRLLVEIAIADRDARPKA